MRQPTHRFTGAAAAIAVALFSFGAALGADDHPGSMDPSFDVLLKKSIFSRNRTRGGSAQASTSPSTAPARVLSPEQSVAFRGVLCPDEEYVAFMENVQNGQITIVKAGDEIARGRVAAITLDSLAYDSGGKVHTIRLGQDLTGETAASGSGGAGGYASTAPSAAGSVSGTGTSAAAPGAAPAGSDPALEAIKEQMRQKRLKEGGR
jgi:hypothetical protein